ncbi:hypothetical protein CVS30_05755 [Arthrobacter psychrolactophilus]|uniref:Uncharacterized protein n=1 Tax=Arthrobacter psychrolactophilus TaxID=92442 RepID=A0A2V5JMQ5_9MICC|nr:hypothetical protein [Arthrobacter psychrolactophilus]PYI39456.1 hypothetical protein CVS30_05755 [Arthrobacter psychrolactophilus]
MNSTLNHQNRARLSTNDEVGGEELMEIHDALGGSYVTTSEPRIGLPGSYVTTATPRVILPGSYVTTDAPRPGHPGSYVSSLQST